MEHGHESDDITGVWENINSAMTGDDQFPWLSPAQPISLVPAIQFSIEELADIYNQSRADYLVPMPMTPSRLAFYVKAYDIDLACSRVATCGGEILGLAMLGIRPGRTWITRLGVLPQHRRTGTGEVLIRALLDETRHFGFHSSFLEVIQGNVAAHALFMKMGFHARRELLVLRRSPGTIEGDLPGKATWLGYDDMLGLLSENPVRPAWTNEIETYINTGDVQGLAVNLGMSGQGWMVFRYNEPLLSHFILCTEKGNVDMIARVLLAHLYARFPSTGTYIENLPAEDEHYLPLKRLGFVDVFRRIEMEWNW